MHSRNKNPATVDEVYPPLTVSALANIVLLTLLSHGDGDSTVAIG